MDKIYGSNRELFKLMLILPEEQPINFIMILGRITNRKFTEFVYLCFYITY